VRLPTVFPKLATCFPGGAVTMLQLENSNRGQPMSTQPKPHYSFEDYLAAERDCIDAKHEYVAGQVFALTLVVFIARFVFPEFL
jgi:hypothetical protein